MRRSYPLDFQQEYSLQRSWRALLVRVTGWWLRLAYRIEYCGAERFPQEGPLFIACNHISAWDSFAVFQKSPRWIHWVGKQELLRLPGSRRVFLALGMIPVNRKTTDLQTARMILGAVQAGRFVGVFPEGTRVPQNASGADYPPKSGIIHFAQRENTPILPVAIEGEFRLFRKVRIIFGEPYRLNLPHHPSKEEGRRLAIDLMQRIYGLMGRAYNLPTSEEDITEGEPLRAED